MTKKKELLSAEDISNFSQKAFQYWLVTELRGLRERIAYMETRG